MDVLLIILMIGIFLFGYVIMLRVDKFIAGYENCDEPRGKRKRGILIFGSDKAAFEARNEGIEYTELKEPVLPRNDDCYSAALLLSKNESENLALCEAMCLYDPDIYVIVRCDDPMMENVYKRLGADRIILPDESAKMVLEEVWRALR